MAEIGSIVYTLVTPWGTITFNAATGDQYRLSTDSTGLDGAPLRTQVDDAPQTDGGLVHNFYKGARHVTLIGQLRVISTTVPASVIAARNTLEDNLIAACESIIRADGTLSFTRTGGTIRHLTVRCDMLPTFSGSGPVKSFALGLVAANPNWT